MKTIRDIDISGKTVLIRVDFNVPLNDQRQITDDGRIRAVLPTVTYAINQGAKVVLASHLGRPKGQVVAKFSLSPVADRLGELLDKPVTMAPDCVGQQVAELIRQMQAGDVVLLENLRFHAAEQENDPDFASQLASLCDVYVNDAFAVSHRTNASVVAVVKFAHETAAGMLLSRELDYFEKAMADPQRPLVSIVGGAKVSSKLKALENMLRKVNICIIGGAMANTFLKSKGLDVGASLVEDDLIDAAAEMMRSAADSGIQFFIPIDVVVAERMDQDANARVVPVDEIPAGWMALDIGPATVSRYAAAIDGAKTIVWNGPMGVFEMEPFSHGTMDMVRHVASSPAMTIVGGGDTDAALHRTGLADKISYISTGGGAFLKLLEGKTLPAVAALNEAG